MLHHPASRLVKNSEMASITAFNRLLSTSVRWASELVVGVCQSTATQQRFRNNITNRSYKACLQEVTGMTPCSFSPVVGHGEDHWCYPPAPEIFTVDQASAASECDTFIVAVLLRTYVDLLLSVYVYPLLRVCRRIHTTDYTDRSWIER